MTDANSPADKKIDLVTQAEELMVKRMKDCSTSAPAYLSGNAAMLIAATYALQVARGDENITPPQIGVEAPARSVRVTGIGSVRT
jgi:hypothetical protein